MSFGAQLKRERELRGISLEEISEATKISVRMLEALESDRFGILPEGIFRKSFIKSYATYIGMDADKTFQEYALATGVALDSATEDNSPQPRQVSSLKTQPLKVGLAVAFGILLFGLAVWYFGFGSDPTESNTQTKPLAGPIKKGPEASTILPEIASSSPPSINAQNSVEVDATPPQAHPGSIIPSASGKPELRVLGERAKKSLPLPGGVESASSETLMKETLSLKIEASEISWISVGAGETALFTGLVHPQEVKSFSLEKPLRVTLGNAGGLRLLVNDKPLIRVGKSGEVRILDITAENYTQYLAPRQ